jgi:hypothetical protein
MTKKKPLSSKTTFVSEPETETTQPLNICWSIFLPETRDARENQRIDER